MTKISSKITEGLAEEDESLPEDDERSPAGEPESEDGASDANPLGDETEDEGEVM